MRHIALTAAIALVASILSQYGLSVCGLMGCTCKTTGATAAISTGCCCGDKCDCCDCCKSCSKAAKPISTATYAESRKAAQDASKPMLILFHAAWCGPCKQMEATYADAAVVKAMGKYIVHHCDTDQDKATAKQFAVHGIPAYMVVDAGTEKAVKSGSGYKAPKSFIAWLP